MIQFEAGIYQWCFTLVLCFTIVQKIGLKKVFKPIISRPNKKI